MGNTTQPSQLWRAVSNDFARGENTGESKSAAIEATFWACPYVREIRGYVRGAQDSVRLSLACIQTESGKAGDGYGRRRTIFAPRTPQAIACAQRRKA